MRNDDMTSGAEVESFPWLTSSKSADVESSNDEETFFDRESGKDSSKNEKTTVFQHGKIVEWEILMEYQHGKMAEMRKMGEAICKIVKRNNNGRCISMYFGRNGGIRCSKM
jgi:hypothetical protein